MSLDIPKLSTQEQESVIHIIKHEEQPLYSQCNESLSIKHIVLDCSVFVNTRNILNQPSSMKKTLGNTTYT